MAARISSPVFIGRSQPLARLELATAHAAATESNAVVVAGEAGIGKTRLVRELTKGGHGARVLIGACIDLGEGGPPFSPMVEVLRTLVRDVGADAVRAYAGLGGEELGRLVPELGLGGHDGFLDEPAGGTARIFEVMLGLLERLARQRPLLLIVEDIHWADRSTRDLLSYLIRHLGPARVTVVMTVRTDDLHRGHPLRPFLVELERGRHAERLDLERFDRGELLAQLSAILGEVPRPELVDAVFSRSEGNPFFAEELLAAGTQLRSGELPPSLRDVLLIRAEPLSAPAQDVLRRAAVAGRTVHLGLLAAIAQRDDSELRELLRESVAQQLIEPGGVGVYEFRHALLQEALYSELLPDERVEVHRACACALAAQPELVGADRAGVPALLAHHWYEAREFGAALSASLDAALAAEHVAAIPEARRHYERALDLWPGGFDEWGQLPVDHIDLLNRLSDTAHLVGDCERALDLIDIAIGEARALDEPLRISHLLTRRGRYLWTYGAPDAALTMFEEALATCPVAPPSPQRARALAAYGRALIQASRNAEAADVCRETISAATSIADRATEGHARTTLAFALGAVGQYDESLAQFEVGFTIAKDLNDVDHVCRSNINRSEVLLRMGRCDEGFETALEGASFARQFGLHRGYGSYLLANAAMISFERGTWDEADDLTQAALALDAPRMAALRVRVVRARLLVARGDLDGAALLLAPALETAAGADDVEHGGFAHAAEAERLIASGAPLAALEAAQRAVTSTSGTDDTFYVEPATRLGVEIASDLADAARARRDEVALAHALESAQPFLARAELLTWADAIRTLPPRTRGELATIDALRARLEGNPDTALWRIAAETWRGTGAPYAEAQARVRLAESLLAAGGSRIEVAEQLDQAATMARQLNATPLRERVTRAARWARIDLDRPTVDETEEDDTGGADRPAFALTPREREVLALVFDGRTNRQIAEALFINEKTASVHVSNILRKLSVSNRAEAAAVAHRAGLLAR